MWKPTKAEKNMNKLTCLKEKPLQQRLRSWDSLYSLVSDVGQDEDDLILRDVKSANKFKHNISQDGLQTFLCSASSVSSAKILKHQDV